MAIVKRRNERTEARMLLESDDPVELPPAEIADSAVVVNFETFKPHIPELLEALRAGATVEPVPVMLDGSTFVVHGATRSFWVKLWHAGGDLTHIERAQIISCLPSTRGVQIVIGGESDDDDDDFDEDDEDYDDDGADEDLADDADDEDAEEEEDNDDDRQQKTIV